jgi:hypothetical protein
VACVGVYFQGGFGLGGVAFGRHHYGANTRPFLWTSGPCRALRLVVSPLAMGVSISGGYRGREMYRRRQSLDFRANTYNTSHSAFIQLWVIAKLKSGVLEQRANPDLDIIKEFPAKRSP